VNILAGREADVISQYVNGASARSLATRFNVSDQTVRRLLDRSGVAVRRDQPQGQPLRNPRRAEPDPQIAALSQRPTELAYIAGLIDGEGCLLIYRKADTRGNLHIRCILRISNTSARVIEWLQERLGGVAASRNEQRPGHLRVMHWPCEGPRLTQLLEAVRPYLVIKPELADILMEMQRTLNYSNTGLRLPEVVKQEREAIFARYKAERQEMKGR
jgi:hypothetical protein